MHQRGGGNLSIVTLCGKKRGNDLFVYWYGLFGFSWIYGKIEEINFNTWQLFIVDLFEKLQTTLAPVAANDSFPAAAIVAIAIGGYLFVFGIILLIRQCLLVSMFLLSSVS